MKNNKIYINKKILLKLSGECLKKGKKNLVDFDILNKITNEIKNLFNLGIQIGIVIGGGNLFRGSQLKIHGIKRNIGDHIGMMSTLINGLFIYNHFERLNIKSQLISPFPFNINGICESYNIFRINKILKKK